MSKVLCFSNQKGGVAKTTTAFNVAGVIANFRYKVLMIDADPHSGLTESFGYEPDQLENTFYNVLIEKDYPIEKALIKTEIPNIDLIPANLDLAAAERELIGMVQWDKKIYNIIKRVRDNYDFILIDCPPSLGVLTMCSFVASDLVLVPIQTELLAMKAIKHLYAAVVEAREGNPELEIKYLLTMYDSRTKHSQEVVNSVRGALGENVFENVIPRSTNFPDSTNVGKPLTLLDPKSKGALAYYNLTREILNHLNYVN